MLAIYAASVHLSSDHRSSCLDRLTEWEVGLSARIGATSVSVQKCEAVAEIAFTDDTVSSLCIFLPYKYQP